MSDDTTDAGDEALTASGGICAPLSTYYDLPSPPLGQRAIDFQRPLTAPRGKFIYPTPPAEGWGPPPVIKPIPWRTRKADVWRDRIGGWMVKHGHRIQHSRCYDPDDVGW